MTRTAAERFAAKVNTAGPIPLVRGVHGRCHLWTPRPNAKGYGTFWHNGRTTKAHRTAYELHVGPIPAGHEIDHRCRNRACVRPSHLRPLTHRENVLASTNHVALRAAQTHCIRGHAFDEANTIRTANNTRRCRACKRAADRAAYTAARAITPAPHHAYRKAA